MVCTVILPPSITNVSVPGNVVSPPGVLGREVPGDVDDPAFDDRVVDDVMAPVEDDEELPEDPGDRLPSAKDLTVQDQDRAVVVIRDDGRDVARAPGRDVVLPDLLRRLGVGLRPDGEGQKGEEQRIPDACHDMSPCDGRVWPRMLEYRPPSFSGMTGRLRFFAFRLREGAVDPRVRTGYIFPR